MPWLIALFSLLALFLLYLFLIAPRRHRAAGAYYASWNYAHRGLHDDTLPENSLAAFDAACRAGYGIELDVQLSRDGVPMVFHDATLTRVCGIDAPLSDYTAEELGRMTLCGKAGHTVPTFAEVLRTVGGRVPLLVEIKGGRHVAPVCEGAAALLDAYGGEYCIESFSPYAVRWFRKHRPGVVRGQLSDRLFAEKGYRNLACFLVESMLVNFLTRPDFIAYRLEHCHVPSFYLARRLLGARAYAWTVKDEKGLRRSRALFDCVIFEGFLPDRRREE